MLVVDRANRRLFSCAPDQAAMPYVRVQPGDVDGVQRLLYGVDRDSVFFTALSRELGAADPVPPVIDRFPERLLETACRTIARGWIEVAQTLPDQILVVFAQPTARVAEGAVQFADATVARRFLADSAKLPASLAALRAALLHPAGATAIRSLDARRPLPGSRRSAPGRTIEPNRAHEDTADLLVNGDLALLPTDFAPGTLRLVWAERWVPRIPPPPPPPADPGPGLPDGIPDAPGLPSADDLGPLSQLPDLPATLSPQALALQEASQLGIPFCQECAKALENALG